MALNRQLDAWAGRGLLIKSNSLSVLLKALGVELVFRLLCVLNGRGASVGVEVHYHLEAAAVNGWRLATLRPAFGAVGCLDGEGWKPEVAGGERTLW
jgi:hypothetical protein